MSKTTNNDHGSFGGDSPVEVFDCDADEGAVISPAAMVETMTAVLATFPVACRVNKAPKLITHIRAAKLHRQISEPLTFSADGIIRRK